MSSTIEWKPRAMPTLLINRIARVLAKQVDEELKVLGITASQLPVMAALKNGEALSQKELANIACVEQPSMAQLLSRMERDGLIKREASSVDRRSSVISLTEPARTLLEPGRTILRSLDEEVCSVLSRDEREMLVKLLWKMAGGGEDEAFVEE